MATLFTDTLQAIREGMNLFLIAEDLADETYVKWLKNGGYELNLGAFKLTNRQMYWLARAHRQSSKTAYNPRPFEYNLFGNFDDAFNCKQTKI